MVGDGKKWIGVECVWRIIGGWGVTVLVWTEGVGKTGLCHDSLRPHGRQLLYFEHLSFWKLEIISSLISGKPSML